MQVLIGNSAPHECVFDKDSHECVGHNPIPGPAVTRVQVPDEYTFTTDPPLEPGASGLASAVALHLTRSADGITQLPGHEAILPFVHPGGFWRHHSSEAPGWVWSDNPDLAEVVGDILGISVATDLEGLEDHYYTEAGPPGVTPGAATDLQALKVNSGNDIQSRQMGGNGVGATGTASSGGSAPGTTSMTDTGASWTSNQWLGMQVICGNAIANVESNTSTVLTIDGWSQPGAPGSVASTPAGGSSYVITAGTAPAPFVGLTANTGPPASGDTSLAGEITSAGGGLIRKIAVYAHTASAASYTLTPVYTANGSDSLPVTVAMIGVFISRVVANTASAMLFETLLNATATVSAVSDQLTVTESVSL